MVNIISKQFEVLVTKWDKLIRINDFLRVRIYLTGLSLIVLSIILLLITFLVYGMFVEELSVKDTLQHIASGIIDTDASLTISRTKSQEDLHKLEETLLNILIFVDAIMIIASILPLYFFIRKILAPLERISLQQKQLIADVSHELRTPLAVMLSTIEATLIKKRSQKFYQNSLTEQRLQVLYLKNITNDLLMIEDSPAKESFKTVDICALTENTIAMMSSYAKQSEITLTQNISNQESLIYANKTQIQRLIMNILKNAIDYSIRASDVSIILQTTQKYCTLIIADTGIGMNKKVQMRIFDRFYKVNQDRDVQSSGLGLSLVKSIAKAHGAKITLRSNVGKGTSFTVRFLRIP